MKHGRQLVLDFDTMVPTVADYDTADCPIKELLFDKEKLFVDYKKIVKESEDMDTQGNKNLYALNPKFNLIIVSNMADPDCDDEIIQMVLDEIPHIQKFERIFIEPTE